MTLTRGARWGVAVLLALAVALALRVWMDARQKPAVLDRLDPGAADLDQMYGRGDAGESSEGSGLPPVALDANGPTTIRGMVVRPNGEPAPNAHVVAQSAGVDVVYEATTDSSGAFALPGLPPGAYAVEARQEGFGPAMVIGVVPGGARVRLALQGGRTWRGRVLQGEEPVSGALVQLGSPGLFPQRTTVTDEVGRFAFPGLRAGRYEYVVTSRGSGTGFGSWFAIDDAGAGDDVQFDVALQRGLPFRLDVVDARTGEPVEMGVVTFAPGPLHVVSVHDMFTSGVVQVDYLPRGPGWLRVRAPGYLPHEQELPVWGQRFVKVSLEPGAVVRGRVIDAAERGVPLARMSAAIVTPQGARWELQRSAFDDYHRLVRPDGAPFWVPSSRFTTDDEGRFELAGLPAGEVVILARKGGFATAVGATIGLSARSTVDDVVLRMEPGRAVRGRIEDEEGAPIPAALVVARRPEVPAWTGGVAVDTDAAGVFRLEDVASRATLQVRARGYDPFELPVDVPANGLDDLVIRLSRESDAVWRGRILTTRGGPAVAADVWLLRGDSPVPVCRGSAGADGWVRAVSCSSRPERLVVGHPDHAPLVAELGGAEDTRDWTLPTGGEVEIVTQRNAVLATLRPRFHLPEGIWPVPTLEMARWTRQRVSRLAAGPYTLDCAASGFGTQSVDLDVVDGQRVEVLCPLLEKTQRVEIRVVDRQGAPVADALVLADGIDPPLRAVTDRLGAQRFASNPGVWVSVEAIHERIGRGSLTLWVPYREVEPFRIVLREPVGGAEPTAFVEQLRAWGVDAAVDDHAIVVDRVLPDTPADGVGIRRFDLILWARSVGESRFSVGVRREDEVLSFELAIRP